ncbi:MAG: acetate kinase, partial [Candidatus Latescibacteria bacterium]|nr:acetate kinase [Candidatus Latescibacterota bacterium]
MRVLVINCGSSSVKYQLIETADGGVPAKGMVERIGFGDSVFTHTCGAVKTTKTRAVADHTEALSRVLESLVSGEGAVLAGLGEIGAVGHRFVNGGNLFTDSVVVDDDFLDKIERVLDLAPLHNPANLLGIRASIAAMPDTPQVVVFDTAF